MFDLGTSWPAGSTNVYPSGCKAVTFLVVGRLCVCMLEYYNHKNKGRDVSYDE